MNFPPFLPLFFSFWTACSDIQLTKVKCLSLREFSCLLFISTPMPFSTLVSLQIMWTSRKAERWKQERHVGGLIPEDTMICWVFSLKFWSWRLAFPGELEIAADMKLDINALWFKSLCAHKPGVIVVTWHNEMCRPKQINALSLERE